MSKITKRSELYREYARVIDLCEGTRVKPSECVKIQGVLIGGDPEFITHPECYTFALAIVEDKPVFVGDVLYNAHNEKVVITTSQGNFSNYTWNPPKKDEYAHLKQAQDNGKRIAWLSRGDWIIQNYRTDEHFKEWPVDRWKIVEDDLTSIRIFTEFGKTLRVRFTKHGLDGKITAEAVE